MNPKERVDSIWEKHIQKYIQTHWGKYIQK